ncbi:unnamed protein product [Rhizophagus irregularis]|nr:unnamed protein product [Rhizophagus irregularis]
MDMDISPNDHFAEGHFAEAISPKGYFAEDMEFIKFPFLFQDKQIIYTLSFDEMEGSGIGFGEMSSMKRQFAEISLRRNGLW